MPLSFIKSHTFWNLIGYHLITASSNIFHDHPLVLFMLLIWSNSLLQIGSLVLNVHVHLVDTHCHYNGCSQYTSSFNSLTFNDILLIPPVDCMFSLCLSCTSNYISIMSFSIQSTKIIHLVNFIYFLFFKEQYEFFSFFPY